MSRFSFFKMNNEVKLAASNKRRPFFTSESQLEADASYRESEKVTKRNKEKNEKQYRELDRPYVVKMGNPLSHVSNLPNEIPEHYHAVHRTFAGIGKDENGFEIAHELKKSLLNPQSGFKKTFLSEDQFAHDPELLALSKKYGGKGGIEAYEPIIPTNTTRSVNVQLQRLLSIKEHGKAMDRLRKRTSDLSTLNTPEFEPTDMLNLVVTHGGRAALDAGYTNKMPFATPTEPGEDLCKCGRALDKHVSPDEAIDHFSKTGEHLEIHDFGSQSVDTNHSASDSPLLSRYIRKTNADGSTRMVTDQPGNALWSLIKTRNARSGDTSPIRERKYMPMVRIGNQAIKFNRITGYDPLRGPDGRKINSYEQRNEKEEILCNACTKGKKNPFQRESRRHCDDCMHGKVNMITKRDASGNETLEPHTIGLGGGLMKYINESDVPACEHCDNGFKILNDKTATANRIPCSACNATGKTPGLYGDDADGFACGNCLSANSSITVTPDNKCPHCNDGILGNRIVKKGKKWKLLFKTKKYEGNPIFLAYFNTAGHGNTGVDAWKAHGNPNCTRCHGNDEYQTNNELPCNCRIDHFNDQNRHVSPSNASYIHKNHIDVPEKIYFDAMSKAYGKDPYSNPHDRIDMPHEIDPKTGLTPWEQYDGLGARYDIMDGSHKIPVGAERFLGAYGPGVSLPRDKKSNKIEKGMLADLQSRSAKRWKSVNAKYCAAAGDLDDIHKTLTEHFGSMPVNITSQRISFKTIKKNTAGRIDPSTFHPNVQPVIPTVENAIKGLDDPDISRYYGPLDELLQKASHVVHDRKLTGTDNSTHWGAFHTAQSKVLSMVSRFHGEQKAEEVRKALSGLPKQKNVTIPDETPGVEENSNA